jgi:anthranilate synthase component 1
VITVKNGRLTVNGETIATKNPLMDLAKLISRYKVAGGRFPKFFGGLLGYFSYDMVRYFEDIGDSLKDELGQEDAEFMFVKDLIAFDHWREEILLISNLLIDDEAELEGEYSRAIAQIEKMESLIKKGEIEVSIPLNTPSKLNVKSNFQKEEFVAAVSKAKKYIEAGDIFQVVLSQRFEVEGAFKPGEPLSLYVPT